MNVFAKLARELSDINSVTMFSKSSRRCVFIQRSQLVNGFFRAVFSYWKQVRNGSIAFRVADLGIALVLVLHKLK